MSNVKNSPHHDPSNWTGNRLARGNERYGSKKENAEQGTVVSQGSGWRVVKFKDPLDGKMKYSAQYSRGKGAGDWRSKGTYGSKEEAERNVR